LQDGSVLGSVGVMRGGGLLGPPPLLHRHPYAEFKRALERGNLWVAEAAARAISRTSRSRYRAPAG
jgi:hypothetical protein